MEYFSHKYPEYRPVLPSNIIETLKKISYERQIPSSGLSLDYISFAIKEYGFGSKIYSADQYLEHELNTILSTYIESGIPVIIGIKSATIGHAIVAIGRENIDANNITQIKATIVKDSFKVFDYNDIDKKLIFIDDNYPPYQKAYPRNPAEHYESFEWKECSIFCFVVPLHSKIYLEAFSAKRAIYSILENYHTTLDIENNTLIKYFLTSSRSLKDSISGNITYTTALKDLILSIALPKFIWVCELSTKDMLVNNECEGLILIDATEPNTLNTKPLILLVYKNKFVNFAQKFEGNSELFLDDLDESIKFSPYINNLKTFK